MDPSARRELNRGFGDALNRSFEFIMVMLVFGGAGWLLDRQFGIGPVLFVLLSVLGLIGQIVRMWYRYDADMKHHESALAARRSTDPLDRGGLGPGVTT